MRIALPLALASVVLGVASGCTTPPVDDRVEDLPVEQRAAWTVLVYIASDNNLEEFALDDLEELAVAGASDDVQVLVQIDRLPGFTDADVLGLGDFTSTKRLRVNADHTITELEDLGEIDMGAPEAIEDFVAWGLATAPSAHVVLDLWDHGGGWSGFAVDDSSTRSGVLGVEAVRDAVAVGLASQGRERVDILAFDACFMAGLETLRAFAPLADRIVASEEIVPGHGFDYAVLGELVADPSLSADALASIVIDGFAAQAELEGTAPVITLSNIDTSALPALEDALLALAEAIAASDGDPAALTLARARFAAVEFGAAPDAGQASHLVDLDGWAAELETHVAFIEQAGAVRDALAALVVDNHAGEHLAGARGLSVYMPTTAALVDDDYAELVFMDDWHKLINEALVRTTSIPPAFAPDPVQLIAPPAEDEQAVVAARLTDESAAVVVNALVEAGEIGADTLPVLYMRAPARITQNLVEGAVLARQSGLLVDGGGIAHRCFIDVAEDGTRSVPFEYEDAAGQELGYVELVQTFDDDGNITSETWNQRDGAVASELVPVEGGTLYPMVLQVAANGQRRWIRLATVDGVAGAADGIPATFAYTVAVGVLNGPMYVALTARGAGGRGDTAIYSE